MALKKMGDRFKSWMTFKTYCIAFHMPLGFKHEKKIFFVNMS